MSAMPMSSRAYFFGIALAIAGIAFSARAEAQPKKDSGASSRPPMATAKTVSYDKAWSHAGDALQAARGKDLARAIQLAEAALKADAQAAKQEFSKMKVKPDAQRDFSDGMKSLEDAIAAAAKGDGQRTEELLMQTLFSWRPQITLTSEDLKSELELGKCHGELCIPSACGCANPGATNCNRFYPLRKCKTVGCNCYCQ